MHKWSYDQLSSRSSLFDDKGHKGENLGSRFFMALHETLAKQSNKCSLIPMTLFGNGKWIIVKLKTNFLSVYSLFYAQFNAYFQSIQCQFNLMPIQFNDPFNSMPFNAQWFLQHSIDINQ